MMMDIGIVYYRIRPSGDAIDATWYTSRLPEKETGKGLAMGDTSGGFPGEYIITYFYPDGREAGTFDLKIERTGPIYDLTWSKNGELLVIGVGIDTSDGMAAGFRKVE